MLVSSSYSANSVPKNKVLYPCPSARKYRYTKPVRCWRYVPRTSDNPTASLHLTVRLPCPALPVPLITSPKEKRRDRARWTEAGTKRKLGRREVTGRSTTCASRLLRSRAGGNGSISEQAPLNPEAVQKYSTESPQSLHSGYQHTVPTVRYGK